MYFVSLNPMRVINYADLPRNIGSMRTIQELGAQIGDKPYLVKEILTLPQYQGMSILKLTERVSDLMSKKMSGADLRKVDALRVEWRLDAGYRIPETTVSEDCLTDGEGGAEILLTLKEKLFDKYDIVEFIDSGHQLYIRHPAESLATDKHLYRCQLLADDYSNRLNLSAAITGKTVRFITGGVVPEASERGSYFQIPNRVEKHTNFITRFRVSGSRSGDYAWSEQIYYEKAKKDDQGTTIGYEYFRQDPEDKAMMDKLMLAINSGLLFCKGGFDSKLNHLVREVDGRPISIGEGIIPQMRRYGQFMSYNFLTESMLRTIIGTIVERRSQKTGNEIVFTVNWILFQHLQIVLDKIVGARLTLQEAFLTKDDGKKAYMVGTNYLGYQFAGNKVFIMHDDALSDRYRDRGYGICLNTRVLDKNGKDQMNVQQFSIRGAEIIKGDLLGFGMRDGVSSGNVSTMVHASESSLMAYRMAALYDPYSTFILEQN